MPRFVGGRGGARPVQRGPAAAWHATRHTPVTPRAASAGPRPPAGPSLGKLSSTRFIASLNLYTRRIVSERGLYVIRHPSEVEPSLLGVKELSLGRRVCGVGSSLLCEATRRVRSRGVLFGGARRPGHRQLAAVSADWAALRPDRPPLLPATARHSTPRHAATATLSLIGRGAAWPLIPATVALRNQ